MRRGQNKNQYFLMISRYFCTKIDINLTIMAGYYTCGLILPVCFLCDLWYTFLQSFQIFTSYISVSHVNMYSTVKCGIINVLICQSD